jgi:tetratricopeptide (TPR) repeat protein
MDTEPTASVPDAAWDGFDYTSVHAVVLCAGIENIAAVAAALPPPEFDQLISAFQQAMLTLVDDLRRQKMPIGEVRLSSDEIHLFFYDSQEVARNYQLDGPSALQGAERTKVIRACRASDTNLAISALKAAIQLKNAWLIQDCNLARVRFQMEPHQLSVGIHAGRAYLRTRPDGVRRIEGYPLYLARELQRLYQHARYSHIFVSQYVHDKVIRSVVKHTQLRQRIFFHTHQLKLDSQPGAKQSHAVHELRLYHRIGIHIPPEVIDQYEAIFALDRANLWSYYQLVDHYAFTAKEWSKVYELAKLAHLIHPQDEKAVLDLAKYYLHLNKFEQSKKCAERALRINEHFDLAHEHLAIIADKLKDTPAMIEHWRNAVFLSPESPVNNFNLGLALLLDDQVDNGYHYIQEALRIYPEYSEWQIFREALNELRNKGKLPALLEDYIHFEVS